MNKKLFIFIFLLILVPVIWPLLVPGYFTHHDNLQVIRIFEMKKCLLDLQIPCRWVPDMGYGYGFPLFNYYGPFVYYLGGILSFIFGYITSAKILFLLSFVVGFLGMFLFARDLFGNVGGFVSAFLFLYAPYRALDVYVRGALAEVFAISLIPFVFYFAKKLLFGGGKRYFLLLTVSLFCFLTTHNVMVMIFVPVFFVWLLFLVFILRKRSKFRPLILALVFGFGLSAFFLLPAFFEKGLVQIESLTKDELDFRAHFVKVSQLFWDRSWHYGASQPQKEDTISFQVGWPHWWLVVFSLPILFFNFLKKRTDHAFWIAGFFILFFLFSVFMTHNKSAFIWEKIGILSFAQFPWRFLSLAIFSSSLVGGYLISRSKGKSIFLFSTLVFFLTLLFNWSYFRPEKFVKVNDKEMLTGENWEIQQKGAIKDYLPVGAKLPISPAPSTISTTDQDVIISNFYKKTKSWGFYVKTDKNFTLEFPVFNFPFWEVKIDGVISKYSVSNSGLLVLDLPKGGYKVEGVLKDTPLRKWSNLISLFSFLAFLYLVKNEKNIEIFR